MKKPVRSRFNVESQYITAMKDYARSKEHTGVLQIKAVFNDGSVFTDTVERAPAIINYKCFQGETYEIEYNSNKFIDIVYTDSEPMTLAQTKCAITEWLHSKPESPVEISFSIIEA